MNCQTFSWAMQLHLDEIATKVTPRAHAIVLLDQAGWHGAKVLKVPSNISLLLLPPRAPELNGLFMGRPKKLPLEMRSLIEPPCARPLKNNETKRAQGAVPRMPT